MDSTFDSIYCPISYQIMENPVITPSGFTYERKFLEEWLITNPSCPMTGQYVDNELLVPNRIMKNIIDDIKRKNIDIKNAPDKYTYVKFFCTYFFYKFVDKMRMIKDALFPIFIPVLFLILAGTYAYKKVTIIILTIHSYEKIAIFLQQLSSDIGENQCSAKFGDYHEVIIEYIRAINTNTFYAFDTFIVIAICGSMIVNSFLNFWTCENNRNYINKCVKNVEKFKNFIVESFSHDELLKSIKCVKGMTKLDIISLLINTVFFLLIIHYFYL